MSFASKYLAAVTFLTILLFLFFRFYKKPMKIIIFVLVFMISFYVFNPQIWDRPVQDTYYSLMYSKTYKDTEYVRSCGATWYTLVDYLRGYPPAEHNVMYPRMHTFFFYLGILGLPLLFKKSKILFTWYVFNFMFLVFYPIKWAQYLFVFLPAMSISAGYLLTWVVKKAFFYVKRIEWRGWMRGIIKNPLKH